MNENAKKEYLRWLSHADGAILEELKAMEGNEALIESRFGHKQTFGTAGIRSVMGAGIANLNEYTVRQAARGLAKYLADQISTAVIARQEDAEPKFDINPASGARPI